MITTKLAAATTGLAGLASGGLTALAQVSIGPTSAVSHSSLAWTVGGSFFGAGMVWGLLQGKVKAAHAKALSAHARTEEEKEDRIKAIDDFKTDVNRGFERVERTMETNTQVILAALNARNPEARTRMADRR